MGTTARSRTFTEPARPENLQIRFVTIGGAFVDVIGLGEHRMNRWTCHGCKDSSRFPEDDYLFRIRDAANDHAAACRAIPLT
ncbi:hypothetical protein OH717_34415 (plasmid) [Streptomyces albidoflavus]|uniref:hypothetical protein n=1 Tax=Streptomyces TaxID=1883 RepID=UPI002F90A93F|nr:hypothetical protein OH717_34415 [Streptomyces albidoflavus]